MVDVKILYIINTIILLFVSTVLVINYKKQTQNKAIMFLTYFILLHFIGFILLILRNKILDFISIIVANTLFAAGTICLYMTIRAIAKVKPVWHNRYLIPLVTYFLGFILFTYIDFDTKTRMLIYYLFCSLYLVPSAWYLWSINDQKYKLFDKVSAILFTLISIVLIWIIIQVSFIQIETYYFSNTNIFLVLSIVIINILSFWSLATLRYRIKN